MAESSLAADLAAEQADAVRALLATPVVDADQDPETFRLVVRHRVWLTTYFETACGWRVSVDAGAGFARLAKRSSGLPDPTRPLQRVRQSRRPAFGARGYELLCLVCAELVRHPVTTMGLLAGAVTAESGLETERQAERSAFVDAVLALRSWGVVRVASAEVEAYVGDRRANAILTADTSRLHQLLCSAQAPSALPADTGPLEAIDALCVEPRYGVAPVTPEEADEGQRLRWVRHRLARMVLDDPAVELADLGATERDYLANPAGRRWLRERVAEAGLVLEERADGLLAVDPSGRASDRLFPAPNGNVAQLALLLVDRLVRTAPDGSRRLVELRAPELAHEVHELFRRFPSWARGSRDGTGPQTLADGAVALLVAHGLCRQEQDGTLVPLPAVARYRVGEPKVLEGQGSLFEEEP